MVLNMLIIIFCMSHTVFVLPVPVPVTGTLHNFVAAIINHNTKTAWGPYLHNPWMDSCEFSCILFLEVSHNMISIEISWIWPVLLSNNKNRGAAIINQKSQIFRKSYLYTLWMDSCDFFFILFLKVSYNMKSIEMALIWPLLLSNNKKESMLRFFDAYGYRLLYRYRVLVIIPSALQVSYSLLLVESIVIVSYFFKFFSFLFLPNFWCAITSNTLWLQKCKKFFVVKFFCFCL